MLGSPIERVCVFWSNVFWGGRQRGALVVSAVEEGVGSMRLHGVNRMSRLCRDALSQQLRLFFSGGVFILGETRLSFIVLLA